MILKLLAPVQIDFSLVTEAPIRDPEGYAEFWQRVDGRKAALHKQMPVAVDGLFFPHSLHTGAYNRYRSLESDSLERTLHVMELHLDRVGLQTLLGDPPDPADKSIPARVSRQTARCVCRVFDHNLALLEIDVALDDWLQTIAVSDVAKKLDALQAVGIDLGERLARKIAAEVLTPLFHWLDVAFPESGQFIEKTTIDRVDRNPIAAFGQRLLHGEETAVTADASGLTSIFETHGTVLWVTRTLIFEEDYAQNHAEIIQHWLKDSGGQEKANEEATQTLAEEVASPDHARGHLTHWLNYLFTAKARLRPLTATNPQTGLAQPFCDAWEAMLHAQFFYGALDLVDFHLTRILANALSRDSSQQIDELKLLLERNIRKANLLLIQLHDTSKYYQRAVKAELDEILAYWDFDAVLAGPVQEKITLCQNQLTWLHQEVAANSAIYTDMILLGIGVTSIFGTLLALAEYGRTLATDADLASYDATGATIIDWFAAQPTDVILVASTLLSLLLVVLYFYYRKLQTM